MTTTLAKVTALALLAASFAFSGSLACADTEDTTSIQILTFDAVGDPGQIVVALDCDTGDGVGSCPVGTTVVADATASTIADAFDPAVLEAMAEPAVVAKGAEPTIGSVDAIAAVVTGETDATIQEPAQAASTPAHRTETITEDKITTDASVSQPNEKKAARASTTIVVELTQSSTLVGPGQAIEDEPAATGSIAEPSSTTPVSMLDGKNCTEDF
jgi:hypothetical protein